MKVKLKYKNFLFLTIAGIINAFGVKRTPHRLQLACGFEINQIINFRNKKQKK